MVSQFKLNVLISFDSSVVWGCLSCTIKITFQGGWLMVGGWKPATLLLKRYLCFVVNSPELCGDLRGEEWSLCMPELEGQPPHCNMNVQGDSRFVSFH